MKYNIGEKIRILRTMKGYSQQGLAKTIGLKQENISYLESNKAKKEISIEFMKKLANAFDMPLPILISYLKAEDPVFPVGTDLTDIDITLEKLIATIIELMEKLRKLNATFL
jgi:transcriptional regulator with XRE-family HTH domain